MSPPTAASAMPARAIVPSRELERGAGGGDRPVARRGGRPSRRRCRSRRAAGRGSRPASRPGRPRSGTGPRWNSCMSTTRSPPRAADDHPRADRRAHGGQVLGRVGLAQRAADRAAVAHDRVGDHALGVGEDRQALARAAADSSRSRWRVIAPMRTSPSCSRDVARARRPADRCRSRTRAPRGAASSSAAGEWPPASSRALRAELLEQRERLLDARRPLVVKRCWDLQIDPFASLLRGASGPRRLAHSGVMVAVSTTT